ncbi:PadR family transcriptional regulator [Natronobacterium haloterrestre]|nr:PadR family transcriptional regulator [Halobiforma haloterrestris]
MTPDPSWLPYLRYGSMFENDSRGLECPDQTDASPIITNQAPTSTNTAWTALSGLQRDLLATVASLEKTTHCPDQPTIKTSLENQYDELLNNHIQQSLNDLHADNIIKSGNQTYYLTQQGRQLLEVYTQYLVTACYTDQVVLHLERPITPGDLEQLYTRLEEVTRR